MAAVRASTSNPARGADPVADPRWSNSEAVSSIPFELIETLRWSAAEGFYLLKLHLQRLAASADYFSFHCDLDDVRRRLTVSTEGLGDDTFRVRLWLNTSGQMRVAATPINRPSADTVYRFAFSAQQMDSADGLLYHKTTRREVYSGELARLSGETECDDVIFHNERGELTEGSWTNVFIERANRLFTPPVACGLLNGTLRQALFSDSDVAIEECILFPYDLVSADRVFLGNSVRGLVRALPVAEIPAQLLTEV